MTTYESVLQIQDQSEEGMTENWGKDWKYWKIGDSLYELDQQDLSVIFQRY